MPVTQRSLREHEQSLLASRTSAGLALSINLVDPGCRIGGLVDGHVGGQRFARPSNGADGRGAGTDQARTHSQGGTGIDQASRARDVPAGARSRSSSRRSPGGCRYRSSRRPAGRRVHRTPATRASTSRGAATRTSAAATGRIARSTTTLAAAGSTSTARTATAGTAARPTARGTRARRSSRRDGDNADDGSGPHRAPDDQALCQRLAARTATRRARALRVH